MHYWGWRDSTLDDGGELCMPLIVEFCVVTTLEVGNPKLLVFKQ